MLRKILAVLLVLVMMVGVVPTTVYAQTEKTTTADTTIIETSDKVVAKQEVEGQTLSCEYIKNTQEYFLYIGQDCIPLSITKNEDVFLVTVAEDSPDVYETKVVAQAVTYVTLTLGFLTAAVLYASRDIIVAGVSAVVEVGSEVINVSLNALITTINKVKSRKITTANVSAKSSSARKAAVTAITTINNAKKKNESRYWTAEIRNGEIVPIVEISKSAAISRLKKGYDVFTTTSKAAAEVCKSASPRKRAIPHTAHVKAEGYYYHFHPDGVKWYKNSKYQPHCWYII